MTLIAKATGALACATLALVLASSWRGSEPAPTPRPAAFRTAAPGRPIPRPGPAQPVTATARPARDWEIRLTDRMSGRPLPGARLLSAGRPLATTDARGLGILYREGGPPGDLVVQLAAEHGSGRFPLVLTPRPHERLGTVARREVRLPALGALSLRLAAPAARPGESVLVRVRRLPVPAAGDHEEAILAETLPQAWAHLRGGETHERIPSHRIALEDALDLYLPPGPHVVELAGTERWRATHLSLEIAAERTRHAVLELRPRPRVEGLVLDAHGRPLPGAEVAITLSATRPRAEPLSLPGGRRWSIGTLDDRTRGVRRLRCERRVRTDREGRFRIAPPTVGDLDAICAPSGHRPVMASVRLEDPDCDRDDLVLRLGPPTSPQMVRVRDASGAPVPGLRLTIGVDANRPAPGRESPLGYPPHLVVTDDTGHFDASALALGVRYVLACDLGVREITWREELREIAFR